MAVTVSAFGFADQLNSIAQVGLAAILGAVVGWERDRAGKNAGIRTHMLVSAASALAVTLGSLVVAKNRAGDPTRMIHAVFTGIGFIGGGMIWTTQRLQGPQGLTSAATVLLVAGIGAACGVGAPILAVGVCLLALITLVGMHRIEKRVHRETEPSSNPVPFE
jgi:putative Mg2+ transporter-C (MgtC) family protein